MSFSGQLQPKLLRISYGATSLLALTVPTSLFLKGGQYKFGIWFEDGGPAFVLFILQFAGLAIYGNYLLYKASLKAAGSRRAQLLCLFVACVLGFGGGFMWFLPALGIDIPPLGAHLIALYCVVVMYAIVRYQFLDIQVVIRRSLVYSLLITLLTVGYFGLVYGIERGLQVTFGYRSAWVSLTAFALMALAFQPLKIVIQRVVDRLIFGVSQEQLAQRMERLEEQARQTEKLRAVSTLAAGMAHEIKNPLTALRTFGEYLPEKHNDPEFVQKFQDILNKETHRIQAIVQDVLDFAKPRAPRMKPVNLGTLLHSTTNLLSGDLLKRNIECRVDCGQSPSADDSVADHVLHADPDQLRQVLINLIQNAADAMPNGGKLSIATQQVNSHLELTVSDTGHGIPKELLSKIFDPFVTTKSDGNGLGLAMVHSIIRAHGGTIRASSELSHGTTFTVVLPL